MSIDPSSIYIFTALLDSPTCLFLLVYFRRSTRYLFELLGLCFICRTYRLTITAAVYALFVPAACFAEGFPFCRSERKPKFFVCLLIWFGLLAYSISVAASAESSGQVQNIRERVIVLFGILCSLILASSFNVESRRRETVTRGRTSAAGEQDLVKPFQPSWSNILAVIAAPAETIQLGAVGKTAALPFYQSICHRSRDEIFSVPFLQCCSISGFGPKATRAVTWTCTNTCPRCCCGETPAATTPTR
jgi:hypothetical protein